MVEFLRENENECPAFYCGVNMDRCSCCPFRGTIWLKEDNTITVKCRVDEKRDKSKGKNRGFLKW